jgi:hypothetical protein
LDLREIRRQYDDRLEMHNALRFEFDHGNVEAYVHLAIGLHDPTANYSAAEHGLGPRILANSSPRRIFDFANELFQVSNPKEIPDVIMVQGYLT